MDEKVRPYMADMEAFLDVSVRPNSVGDLGDDVTVHDVIERF